MTAGEMELLWGMVFAQISHNNYKPARKFLPAPYGFPVMTVGER